MEKNKLEFLKNKPPRLLKDRVPDWVYENLIKLSFTSKVKDFLTQNKELIEIEVEELKQELIKQRASKKAEFAEMKEKRGKVK